MNRKIKISNQWTKLLTLALMLLILSPGANVYSQKRNGKNIGVQSATTGTEKRKAVPEVWISGTITTTDGKVVENALITANEGAIVLWSDENGHFRLKGNVGSFVLVESTGFEPLAYEIKRAESELPLVLKTALLYAGQNDMVNMLMDVEEKQRYIVGAVSGVSGDALIHFPEPLLSNTLQGQVMGLYAQLVSSGLGNNNANLFVRGHHRNGGNGIVTLVDGVERNIDGLLLEEIASVQVMKDATAKILYGSRAANGVVSVTTKHGKMYTRKINVSMETGLGLPVALPNYLNSYEYAMLYNEARQNDGLLPMYTAADLEGYHNSKGPNDQRYPDVDYNDYFLNKTTGYQKASIEFSGGNDNTQYAVVAGYVGNSGLQKIGDVTRRDRYNIRGNLDMKITESLKAFVGIGGIFDISQRSSSLDHAGFFTAIRDTRPNEFPLIIDPIYVPVDSMGYPGLGASLSQGTNLYGELKYGGPWRQNLMNGQLNIGINYDLSMLVKGLSIKSRIGFDNFFDGREATPVTVATYLPQWYYDPVIGKDTVSFKQLSNTVPNSQKKLNQSSNLRTTSYLLGMDYERTFNDIHRISTNLLYHYMMMEVTGVSPNLQTANTALRINYSHSDRYILEFDIARMGSDKFIGKNKYFMSYAGGLGWIVSEENFLKGNSYINYMKVKASGGLLGYDAQTDWNLYQTQWTDNGNLLFKASVTNFRVGLVNWENPNLKWEKSGEFNVGAEALLLNRKLWVEANYFNELRYDIITPAGSEYSALYGGFYFGQDNLERVRNQGIEFEVKYMNGKRDFFYSVGLNGLYSKNKLLASNEVEYPLEYRRAIGKPTDAMFGYVAKGLFGKDVTLAEAPHQTLGYYGVGDIAYENQNDDSLIDENDLKMIGNSFPRFNFGLTVDLSWKGFALNLLGVSSLGTYSWLNNAYYQNYGENKWSELAKDRYHPINNPEGTYPRLTTTNGSNNFVNSTFWLANAGFFRLKNAEISYTFGYNKPLTSALKTVKLFVRGSNIFTISKLKDLDPEVPNAGVNNYPLFSTFTGGLNVVF